MNLSMLHQSPYDAWRWAEEQFSQRDYIGAARTLEGILEHPEADVSYLAQVRELLARSYYHSARLAPAVNASREALLADPTNGYMALLLSRALERQGNKEEAAKYRLRAETLGEEV
ncbi:hypothetical protein [Nocardioides yefusunii]|uniref:Tetratricopeptide repeat protein n=1 Tax=Nocardioides yefusunii TaxID=2500546 RepID=A0ABW1QV67_9ACTN|nr:hypothetical protein [Nocardioides yefusunii]